MNINWKTVITGSVLAIILNFILSFVTLGGIVGYLIATIYVGYTVGGGYRNGANHGAIVGVIEGIVAVTEIGFSAGGNQIKVDVGGDLVLFALVLLIGIIFFGIMGAIGGVIGAFIKESGLSKESAA